MNNNKRGKKGRKARGKAKEQHKALSAKELLLPKHKAVKRSSAPIPPVKTIHEPLPVCPDCGETIEHIAEALTGPDGQYRHFDCVLRSLREEEGVSDGQILSYVGSGNFAIFEKREDGSQTIVKTIPYESRESFDAMKKYVEDAKE